MEAGKQEKQENRKGKRRKESADYTDFHRLKKICAPLRNLRIAFSLLPFPVFLFFLLSCFSSSVPEVRKR